MSDAAITFSDLTLGYNSHAAVHHLNGVVEAGSLTAVVGANGSGKSTLMKAVAGLLKPMSGKCRVEAGRRIAYLPQQSELDRSFPVRVVDIVDMGLWPRRGLLGRTAARDRALIGEALAAVGLAGFEKRPIDTLSGGQFQRALFARVLVQEADIILLDEPFNAIDAKTVADLIALIRGWHGKGLTVMVVAHDLDLVRTTFPQALLLARRPVAWGETAKVLTPETLRTARNFEEAWNDDAPWCAADNGSARASHEPHGHPHHHGAAHDHARPAPMARAG
ncbi:MAG: metal ABC transporter ATP-binding protein [Rhizobiaceae bacterium]|nr:metal ABC transporter ATP-binding protein [Rhizobiaceae bacterium]